MKKLLTVAATILMLPCLSLAKSAELYSGISNLASIKTEYSSIDRDSACRMDIDTGDFSSYTCPGYQDIEIRMNSGAGGYPNPWLDVFSQGKAIFWYGLDDWAKGLDFRKYCTGEAKAWCELDQKFPLFWYFEVSESDEATEKALLGFVVKVQVDNSNKDDNEFYVPIHFKRHLEGAVPFSICLGGWSETLDGAAKAVSSKTECSTWLEAREEPKDD